MDITETTSITHVGFIGLGVMGKPMALNLLRAGYKVTVKSRSRGPVEELLARGAVEAPTARAVALASDVVITMLPNSPDVREVCLGSGGVIEAAGEWYAEKSRRKRPEVQRWEGEGGRPLDDDAENADEARQPDAAGSGSARADDFQAAERLTVIDMSTISPNVSREVGAALAAAGIDYIEAPVSGGDVGAINGTLAIMTGGPEAVFDRVSPVFGALGKSAVRIGDWGAGQYAKLGNNIIAAVTIESIGEAFVLAAKAGVDPEKMFAAIRGGAAACWSLDHKIPKILDRDFKPGFMCKLHLKDLNLALEAGRELGVSLPLTEKTRDMFQELVDAGKGDDDNCSLVRILERVAETEVRRAG